MATRCCDIPFRPRIKLEPKSDYCRGRAQWGSLQPPREGRRDMYAGHGCTCNTKLETVVNEYCRYLRRVHALIVLRDGRTVRL